MTRKDRNDRGKRQADDRRGQAHIRRSGFLSRALHALAAMLCSTILLTLTLPPIGGGCGGGPGTASDASSTANSKATVYYIDDHLGNTQVLTDGEGSVVYEGITAPYGIELDGTASSEVGEEGANETGVDYSYTTKERDEETGLVYFGGRYYSPEMGRWITPDPLYIAKPASSITNPFSSNLYSYARNNPICYVDPFGFDILKLTDEQQGIVTKALQRSVSILNRTNATLTSQSDTENKQLSQWFGNDSAATAHLVSSNLAKVRDELNSVKLKNIRFDDETDAYAYVYPGRSGKIYVGQAFFNAAETGFDSKAGVLVHEATHFKTTIGTKDYVYGTLKAGRLAATDSSRALKNADNYEYFVESTANME